MCQKQRSVGVGGGTHLQILFPTLGSPGCIHDPVGVIVCDPRVAGQAPRHDGVMWPVLVAELQVPGVRTVPGPVQRGAWDGGYRRKGRGSGLGVSSHPPSHSRLEADRGLHPRPAHGPPAALDLRHGSCEVGPGLGFGQPTPPPPAQPPRTYLPLVEIRILGLEGAGKATLEGRPPQGNDIPPSAWPTPLPHPLEPPPLMAESDFPGSFWRPTVQTANCAPDLLHRVQNSEPACHLVVGQVEERGCGKGCPPRPPHSTTNTDTAGGEAGSTLNQLCLSSSWTDFIMGKSQTYDHELMSLKLGSSISQVLDVSVLCFGFHGI